MPASAERRIFSPSKLRARRKAAGITCDMLGFYVGRTTSTIYNYEQGNTRPSADVAADIARYVGCSIEDLYEDADD